MTGTTKTQATVREREALTDLVRIMRDARGDHSALADVRRQTAAVIDETTRVLAGAGVDVDALLDEIDEVLDAESEDA